MKNIKLLKLIIKENFKGERTYINQIMLFEENIQEIKKYFIYLSQINNIKYKINDSSIEDSNILFLTNSSLNKMESSLQESNFIENSKINDTFEKRIIIEESNEDESKKNKSNSLNDNNNLPVSDYNEYLEKSLQKEKESNKINNNKSEKNKENNNVNDNDNDNNNEKNIKKNNLPKIEKSSNVLKIETMIKKNILENDNDNKSIGNVNNKKYNFSDLSSNKNDKNKKIFSYTPNRCIINDSTINDIKTRPYSPNISNIKKNDINIKKEDINTNYISNKKTISHSKIFQNDKGKEKDFEKILQNQLKDLQQHMNSMKKDVFIPGNKYNSYNRSMNENLDFNKNIINPNINKNTYLNRYNTYYNSVKNNSGYNNLIRLLNSENYQNKYNSPINNNKNYINDRSQNNKFNEEQNNNNQIKKSISPKNDIKDQTNNNSEEINRRIDNLEKCVFDIKKEISTMSQILLNISSNNSNQSNLKDQVKQICDEYLNEKMNAEENIKYNNKYVNHNYRQNNNNNNDNHSLYSEFVNEENKQKLYEDNKKFQIEMNKKIDEKLENLGNEIKNQIYEKFLNPSIEKIESIMKKNIDEIKEKIDNINYNYDNINRYNIYKNRINELSEYQDNTGLINKFKTKYRNEKYDEINRLGEKLYQKLMEKEKKLRELSRETMKNLGKKDKNL